MCGRRQNSGEVLGSPRSTSRDSTPTTGPPRRTLRGAFGVTDTYFRSAAWALFRLILTGAAGGRRGVRKRAARGVDRAAAAEENGNLNEGSALALLLRAEAAARDVDCSAAVVLDASPSVRRYTRSLQSIGFGAVRSELEGGAEFLAKVAAAEPGTGLLDDVPDLEVGEVERCVYDRLRFVVSLRDLLPTHDAMANDRVVNCLLTLLECGSPRILRVASLLLRTVLQSVSPAVLGESQGSAAAGSLVGRLFRFIARKTVVGLEGVPPAADRDAALRDCITQPYGVYAGHIAAAGAAECVVTLRVLLDTPQWRPAVISAIESALHKAVAHLDPSSPPTDAAKAAIGAANAALGALGGHTELFRVGVRVCSRDALESGANLESVAGTVVEFSPRHMQVVFDPVLPPVVASMNDMVALDMAPLRQPVAGLGAPAMAALLAMLKLPVHVREPEQDPDAQLTSGGATKAGQKKKKKKKKASPPSTKEAATGDDSPVTDTTLWLSQLKASAYTAVARLAMHACFTEAAVRAGLFHAVLSTALLPVALPTLVQTRYLEDRQVALQAHVVEWACGVRVGAQVRTEKESVELTPQQVVRREQAANLVYVLCVVCVWLCVWLWVWLCVAVCVAVRAAVWLCVALTHLHENQLPRRPHVLHRAMRPRPGDVQRRHGTRGGVAAVRRGSHVRAGWWPGGRRRSRVLQVQGRAHTGHDRRPPTCAVLPCTAAVQGQQGRGDEPAVRWWRHVRVGLCCAVPRCAALPGSSRSLFPA